MTLVILKNTENLLRDTPCANDETLDILTDTPCGNDETLDTLTDTPCGNDETLVSGGIPNLGIEMNRNDIPELDLPNVPGAVPPCDVGAKKKEAKKIRKRVKKQLKKEADRHDAVAKQKKEKAEALRQSIDYCERKPEALQFATDVNKKKPIEKEQCYTEYTEEKRKEERKKNQYLLVCGSNDGCNYEGYRKRQ